MKGMALHRGKVLFYRKDDCHLCEEMANRLSDFCFRRKDSIAIEIDIRDIEDNPDWFRQYREYVPVLVVDDEEVCHYFMDEQALLNALLK